MLGEHSTYVSVLTCGLKVQYLYDTKTKYIAFYGPVDCLLIFSLSLGGFKHGT